MTDKRERSRSGIGSGERFVADPRQWPGFVLSLNY